MWFCSIVLPVLVHSVWQYSLRQTHTQHSDVVSHDSVGHVPTPKVIQAHTTLVMWSSTVLPKKVKSNVIPIIHGYMKEVSKQGWSIPVLTKTVFTSIKKKNTEEVDKQVLKLMSSLLLYEWHQIWVWRGQCCSLRSSSVGWRSVSPDPGLCPHVSGGGAPKTGPAVCRNKIFHQLLECPETLVKEMHCLYIYLFFHLLTGIWHLVCTDLLSVVHLSN